ncbi:hypothetical protein L3X38_032924 [Prunus dulcis]|uniref:Uncharacterized protein n=1 Tax=Prunus dulcis TaxID=3755 RepID=A0AAD4VH47_PRUDU|nr:hypothetical protein L3X38_032924 [Prunus dulcis]
MVTTRSRRPFSSSATPDHSPSRSTRCRSADNPTSIVTLAASRSRLSSSRCSHSSIASSASHHPLISHFVSPVCSTCYTDVVYHCPLLIEEDFDLSGFGSTFVDFLSRHCLLPLVRGLPLPNFQLVREIYANFSNVSDASASLSGIVVRVRGISIPLSFHFISATLNLAPIRFGSSCKLVPDFLWYRQLVNRLYVSPPEVLPTELSYGLDLWFGDFPIARIYSGHPCAVGAWATLWRAIGSNDPHVVSNTTELSIGNQRSWAPRARFTMFGQFDPSVDRDYSKVVSPFEEY